MKRILLITLLLVGFSSFSFAQGLGLNSITAKAGILMPEDPWDTGFQIGAKADLGQLAENIHLVPFLEYWSSGYDFGGASLDLSNVKVGAAAHYFIANVPGLYTGAGLALNFLSIDVPSVNTGFGTFGGGSSSDTEFGVTILGGYKFPVGNMDGVIEAEYNLMELAAFEISFGVEFDMSK